MPPIRKYPATFNTNNTHYLRFEDRFTGAIQDRTKILTE